MEVLALVYAAVLGALVGSFTNVLIHRVPRKENISFPPSHCPKCDHRLGVLDLVPVVSWLSLGGKCRYCRQPINPRYPIIELISSVGYVLIAWRFPIVDSPVATVALWALFTLLLAGSAVDVESKTLPDAFTLPLVVLGVLMVVLGGRGLGLPASVWGAAEGALVGAGLLALIAGFGAWVLRRFREAKHPIYPLGYEQIHLGGLLGVLGAAFAPSSVTVLTVVVLGLAASVAANLFQKRALRLPDAVTLGGAVLALVVLPFVVDVSLLGLLRHWLMGAGLAALVCGVYWAFQPDNEDETLQPEDPKSEDPEDEDPVAMGFGDVKLLAGIGAFLGWQGVFFGLAVAVVLGAVVGVAGRLLGGDRQIPFGPYIALGALVALLTGSAPLLAYLESLGLN